MSSQKSSLAAVTIGSAKLAKVRGPPPPGLVELNRSSPHDTRYSVAYVGQKPTDAIHDGLVAALASVRSCPARSPSVQEINAAFDELIAADLAIPRLLAKNPMHPDDALAFVLDAKTYSSVSRLPSSVTAALGALLASDRGRSTAPTAPSPTDAQLLASAVSGYSASVPASSITPSTPKIPRAKDPEELAFEASLDARENLLVDLVANPIRPRLAISGSRSVATTARVSTTPQDVRFEDTLSKDERGFFSSPDPILTPIDDFSDLKPESLESKPGLNFGSLAKRAATVLAACAAIALPIVLAVASVLSPFTSSTIQESRTSQTPAVAVSQSAPSGVSTTPEPPSIHPFAEAQVVSSIVQSVAPTIIAGPTPHLPHNSPVRAVSHSRLVSDVTENLPARSYVYGSNDTLVKISSSGAAALVASDSRTSRSRAFVGSMTGVDGVADGSVVLSPEAVILRSLHSMGITTDMLPNVVSRAILGHNSTKELRAFANLLASDAFRSIPAVSVSLLEEKNDVNMYRASMNSGMFKAYANMLDATGLFN
ncbi:hypothetical protein HY990_07020 [Candidatus Micrarchaeota archaeon]|nr:hypothetical protein [Candidatus Micrarchaeota archaeon]